MTRIVVFIGKRINGRWVIWSNNPHCNFPSIRLQ